jgi:tellurite resistance protein TerC
MFSLNTALLWSAFVGLVLVLVALDLGVHRNRHAALPPRQALAWSALWIGVAVAFGGFVYAIRGGDAAIAFYTGYVLEKSLSVDNLFVFLLLFRHFRVPPGEQHRVLTWGILGALLFRALLIFGGIELIHHYHFVIYAFAAFLVFTGVRTIMQPAAQEAPIEEGRLVRVLRRILPLAPVYDGGRFFTVHNGRRVGTMLLLVLAVVETTDIFFAVDSIPAIFAVTDDPFIVFSSNILAILGLRALYFALADLLDRLRYLRYGLGTILILVGAKMSLSDLVHVPVLLSLAATLVILGVTIAASLLIPPARAQEGNA